MGKDTSLPSLSRSQLGLLRVSEIGPRGYGLGLGFEAQSLLSTHIGSVREIACGKVAVLGGTVTAVEGAGQRRRKGIWGGLGCVCLKGQECSGVAQQGGGTLLFLWGYEVFICGLHGSRTLKRTSSAPLSLSKALMSTAVSTFVLAWLPGALGPSFESGFILGCISHEPRPSHLGALFRHL